MAEVVEGKRVTWAEGFFDLVIVLAVTQVATLLGEHHQWWGLGRAFVILALVYRTWVLTSLQSNRLGQDRLRDRMSLFGVGLCALVMAIAIPHAYDDAGLLFALAYWAARWVTWGIYNKRYPHRWLGSMGISGVVIGPIVVLGALAPPDWREPIWLVAALLDLSLVAYFGRRHEPIQYDHSHLIERYGLFVLIALGESIVDLSIPLARQAQAIQLEELVAVALCYAVLCLLWWAYFDRVSAAIMLALQGSREHSVMSRHLAYGHFGIVCGIVMIAVGFENVVSQPNVHLTFTHTNLLYGGTVLMLTAMVYLRWTMSRILRLSRVATVLALLATMYVSLLIPAIAALALLTLWLAAMLTLERQWPQRSAWSPTRSTADL